MRSLNIIPGSYAFVNPWADTYGVPDANAPVHVIFKDFYMDKDVLPKQGERLALNFGADKDLVFKVRVHEMNALIMHDAYAYVHEMHCVQLPPEEQDA